MFCYNIQNIPTQGKAMKDNQKTVIIPIAEYEYMKAAADYLEAIEVYEVIKERVINRKKPAKMLTLEELKERLRKRGKNV